GGGCISEVSVVTIRANGGESWENLHHIHRGRSQGKLVLKLHSAHMVANFRCEAAGLRALAQAGAIRVPAVYAFGQVGDQAALALEFIPPNVDGPSRDQFQVFGRQLAKLHQLTTGDRIGWPEDNFLGSAHQPNQGCGSWPEFFAMRRIGFQIRWACDQGLADQSLQKDCETIINRIDELLDGRDGTSSLLHGDLWSGNYLFDRDGRPVLIDPAVYRGCREAEWGMIRWFGNCPPEFEQAYQAQWPMPDGWQRRVGVYLLYHQLNHLNLFGGSYADVCHRTAREVLR
ncbi:MAG: fructosamine kinase family protein, partial [Planctomycetales bacterium]|nr:fructosamine kinase family protein [Planctomycetales bacterium]